jgi:hypothetical protein
MANLQTNMFVVKSYLVGSHAPSNLFALAVAIVALSPPPLLPLPAPSTGAPVSVVPSTGVPIHMIN